MSKFGIDVSEHQGIIDWNKVKSQIDFAILRLGWIGNHNNHTLDNQFERNYSECKRLGIPVGVYVYCYSASDEAARSGANWTIEKLKGKTLELPCYIDMEDATIKGLGKNKLTNICVAFNSIIEANGRWAGVYANLDWFVNYLNKDEIKRRYTTWIAHYGVNENKYEGQYDILQYSSSGKVLGIAGNVDVNRMYRDLVSEIKGSKVENNPVPQPTKSINEIVAEVLAGQWGNGEDRKNRLNQAGYNYETIQSAVNSAVSKPQKTYTVKSGDTLSGIGTKFGIRWQDIASKNGIKGPKYIIYPGQILKI